MVLMLLHLLLLLLLIIHSTWGGNLKESQTQAHIWYQVQTNCQPIGGGLSWPINNEPAQTTSYWLTLFLDLVPNVGPGLNFFWITASVVIIFRLYHNVFQLWICKDFIVVFYCVTLWHNSLILENGEWRKKNGKIL